MPTLLPPEASRFENEPHRARGMAESFGADPIRYDRTRPRYPDALVRRIVDASPGRRVLDVGIGTGIAARQFRAAGCTVLGVEPDPRMADVARRDGVEVELAAFEDWDPAGRSFDAVVSGQAWHWVDPVAGAAKAARVLPPGGRLAVFWNAGQPPAELTEALAGVYERVVPDALTARFHRRDPAASNGYAALAGPATDGIRAAGFAEPEQWLFEWEQAYSRDEWLDQVPTQGEHSQFSPAQQHELLAGIAAAVDALGGAFTMRFTTVAVTAVRAITTP